jgi:hypothetical protein
MADKQAGPADDDGAEGELPGHPAELDVEAIAAELVAAEGFVEERVQRALAPLKGRFPPAVIEEFEDDLRCFLLTHPVASRMLARIRPRTERTTSGEGAIMGVSTDGDLEAPKGKAG